MSKTTNSLFYSTQILGCLWFCGKNNALDSEMRFSLFDDHYSRIPFRRPFLYAVGVLPVFVLKWCRKWLVLE